MPDVSDCTKQTYILHSRLNRRARRRANPYCDIELTPKFDYDLEKAELLNCPAGASSKKKSDSGLSGGMVALIVILAVAVAGLVAGVAFIVMKEKAGEPLFMDVTTKTPLQEKVAPYP